MLLNINLPSWALPFLVVAALTARIIYNRYKYGIIAIPGPFLASCTHLWRFFLVWGRRPEITHIRLHEKFGPLVRLGPNVVSISDPEAIKTIYGLGGKYIKVSREFPILTGNAELGN